MVNLLGVVSNLRGVVAVRETVSGVPTPSTWNAVEAVLGTCHVYEFLVEKHVAARTLELVAGVWNEAIAAVNTTLTAIDEAFLRERKEG